MLVNENTAALGRVARIEGRRAMKPVKLAAVLLAAAMAVGTSAAAQEHYPSRLITVVVPLTANNRARMSMVVPAVKGTTTVTNREG